MVPPLSFLCWWKAGFPTMYRTLIVWRYCCWVVDSDVELRRAGIVEISKWHCCFGAEPVACGFPRIIYTLRRQYARPLFANSGDRARLLDGGSIWLGYPSRRCCCATVSRLASDHRRYFPPACSVPSGWCTTMQTLKFASCRDALVAVSR